MVHGGRPRLLCFLDRESFTASGKAEEGPEKETRIPSSIPHDIDVGVRIIPDSEVDEVSVATTIKRVCAGHSRRYSDAAAKHRSVKDKLMRTP